MEEIDIYFGMWYVANNFSEINLNALTINSIYTVFNNAEKEEENNKEDLYVMDKCAERFSNSKKQMGFMINGYENIKNIEIKSKNPEIKKALDDYLFVMEQDIIREGESRVFYAKPIKDVTIDYAVEKLKKNGFEFEGCEHLKEFKRIIRHYSD